MSPSKDWFAATLAIGEADRLWAGFGLNRLSGKPDELVAQRGWSPTVACSAWRAVRAAGAPGGRRPGRGARGIQGGSWPAGRMNGTALVSCRHRPDGPGFCSTFRWSAVRDGRPHAVGAELLIHIRRPGRIRVSTRRADRDVAGAGGEVFGLSSASTRVEVARSALRRVVSALDGHEVFMCL